MKIQSKIKSISLGVIKVVLYYLFIQLLFTLFLIPLRKISETYWSHLDGRGLNEPWFISTLLCTLLASIIVSFLFLRFVDKKPWSYIGFTKSRSLRYFILGVAYTGSIIIVFALLNILFGYIKIEMISEPFLMILLINLFALSALIIAVLTEEIIFRGYIYKTIETNINKPTAIIVSSFLFSLAHFLNPNLSVLGSINIFLAGVVLAFCYIKYNNLWLPIGIHFGWNLMLWILNFPVSGKVYQNSFIKLSYNNYNLFVGDKFGPEASLLVTALLVGFILVSIFKLKMLK